MTIKESVTPIFIVQNRLQYSIRLPTSSKNQDHDINFSKAVVDNGSWFSSVKNINY
jgi:hypothetical protein